jgi:hypothetical protein
MESHILQIQSIIDSHGGDNTIIRIENVSETSILIKNVDRNIRQKIHEYAEENKICSQSLTIQKSNLKNMIISVNLIKPKINFDEFNKFFVDFYKYPIDIYKNKYFGYHMNTVKSLQPDIEQNYNEMMEILNIKFKGNIFLLKNYVIDIRKKIISTIKENPDFIQLMQTNNTGLKKLPQISSNLFVRENNNKYYVRFDMVKAHFNIMNKTNPNIFCSPNWESFVKRFSDYNFIEKSKILREVIFGELGVTKKMTSIGYDIITTIYDKFKHYEPVVIHGDEIVFEFEKCNYNEIYDFINSEWNNMFRIEKFKLSYIETKIDDIYFEEYFNDDITKEITKYKIKTCPKKYLIQAIKYYQKQKITEYDLKFTDNGMIATFEESIFF